MHPRTSYYSLIQIFLFLRLKNFDTNCSLIVQTASFCNGFSLPSFCGMFLLIHLSFQVKKKKKFLIVSFISLKFTLPLCPVLPGEEKKLKFASIHRALLSLSYTILFDPQNTLQSIFNFCVIV